MAGVPHHALDGYLAKLVLQRRVVALAEQLEAPIPNKLVRRDVVRVVTPGTVIEEQMLEPGRAHLSRRDCGRGRRRRSRARRRFDRARHGDGVLRRVAHSMTHWARSRGSIRPNSWPTFPPMRAPRSNECWRTRARASSRRRSRPFPARSPRSTASRTMSRWRCAATLDALAAFVRRVGVPQSAGEAFRPPQFYSQNAFLALDANTRKHLELHRALGSNAKADAAGDDRPHAHGDGLAAAGALAIRAADRGGRDRRARRLRRNAS